MSKKMRCPVTPRAVLQRINRKLAPDFKAVKKCNPHSRGWDFLGDYYLLDLGRNEVLNTHIDLTDLGKEYDVLKEWETIVDD